MIIGSQPVSNTGGHNSLGGSSPPASAIILRKGVITGSRLGWKPSVLKGIAGSNPAPSASFEN